MRLCRLCCSNKMYDKTRKELLSLNYMYAYFNFVLTLTYRSSIQHVSDKTCSPQEYLHIHMKGTFICTLLDLGKLGTSSFILFLFEKRSYRNEQIPKAL